MTFAGCVYRAYANDGELLYVGATTNPKSRLHQHACDAIWRKAVARWRIRWYTDWTTAVQAEKEAIATEYPRWNITYRSPAHPDGSGLRRLEIGDLYPRDVSTPPAPSFSEGMPSFITTRQAIAILGIDRSALTRWVQFGRVTPAKKLTGPNGAYLFHPADIEQIRRDRAAKASA